MASSLVNCSLNMHQITAGEDSPIIQTGVGTIKILLRSETEYGEVFFPETKHAIFRIPYETLFDRESCELCIWNVISSALGVESFANREFLTRKISAFAKLTAAREGDAGFAMVAEVYLSED